MGQLERYGLYVLCLVIFLILGVAIWGEDPALAQARNAGAPVVLDIDGRAEDRRAREVDAKPLPPVTEAEDPLAKIPKILFDSEGGTDVVIPTPTPESERQQPPTPTPVALARTHTIKDGDTIEALARHYYGDIAAVADIKKANPDVDEKRLKLGAKLQLPERAAKVAAERAPERAPVAGDRKPTASAEGAYVVKPNDTLEKIAKKMYGDIGYIEAIRVRNSIRDDRSLGIKQELILPKLRAPKPTTDKS